MIAWLTLLLLLPSTVAAVSFNGYVTCENEFITEQWMRTATGYHVVASPYLGAVIAADLGHGAAVNIGESAAVATNQSNMPGVTGHRFCAELSVAPHDADATFSIKYSVFSWFVDTQDFGYAYLVDSKGVGQSLLLTIKVKIF